MTDDGLSVLPAEPVSRHTAHRTGGACDVWVVAHDVDGLAAVVADCRKVGWRWSVVGATTRTVFKDGEVPGAVVRLGGAFARMSRDGHQWTVGAAVPVPALVAAAAAVGQSGLEALACVPGSLGASLLHDDGWDEVVDQVEVLYRGSATWCDLDEARRRSRTVLGARLVLQGDDHERVTRRTRRTWVQQSPVPPGSWYAAPRRASLRKVLRSVQLPLVRLRQVAIPGSAPELLVNLGEGTAADLALLHRSAVDRVKQVRGETLTSRVRWVGAAAEAEVP